MLNVSKKFIVSHICPPDSSQPFLINGIAYWHTFPLYLILEIVMTCVRLPRRLCKSFDLNIGCPSSSLQVAERGSGKYVLEAADNKAIRADALSPGQYLERGFPVFSADPTPHTPLTSWNAPSWGDRSTETQGLGEFRAPCKRIPGGDHEPAIAMPIAVGDAVRRKLTASPTASIM
jgi:hypothetical protein